MNACECHVTTSYRGGGLSIDWVTLTLYDTSPKNRDDWNEGIEGIIIRVHYVYK